MNPLHIIWDWSEPMSQRAERARVSAHLIRAEQRLADAKTTSLGPLRRLVRALLLHELRRYRQRQRFPQNADFPHPTPYFIDAVGTRCAVAHLLELSGEHALVQRVARERNHARVRELTDEPRLVAWLTAAGLSLNEAAAIQPEYCTKPVDCVCQSTPLAAVAEVTVIGLEENNVARVQVTAVHGSTSRFKVGEEARIHPEGPATVGDPFLVALSHETETALGDDGIPYAVKVPAGNYQCRDPGSLQLSVPEYVNAVLSTDCVGRLRAKSKMWTEEKCTGGGMCSAAVPGEGAPPTTLGILVVLLTLMVRRWGLPKLGPARSSAPAEKSLRAAT